MMNNLRKPDVDSDSSLGYAVQPVGRPGMKSRKPTLKRDIGFTSALVKFGRSLGRRGLSDTASRCVFHLKDLWFDWRQGMDTSGVVSLANLDLNSVEQGHAMHYEPTPLPVIEEVLQTLGEVGCRFEEFAFVDLGSGKGRTVVRAARYPFKKVVGVEISPGLHQVALQNVVKATRHSSGLTTIECVREDAAQFPIPRTDAVIYLYHPFDALILGRVLENIRASLEKVRSTVYVVYVYPSLSHVIESTGFLKKLLERRTGSGMREYEAGATIAAPFEIWSNQPA
jgi:SAM-dependent methyltransferase